MTIQEQAMENVRIVAIAAGFPEPQTIPQIVGAIIGAFLSLLGIIFVCLIIYGGFLWMTSGGNETKVLKAKKVLQDSVIGLIIIISAYGITQFVMRSLLDAAG